ELRPWAGGWLAAPFMALAALLGGGFGAGMGITVRRALGSNLKLPAGYAYLTLLWGIAGALIVLGGLLLGLGAAIRKVLGRGVPVEVPLLHAGRPVDARSAAPAWWWANWERRHAHQMVLGVTAV